MSGAQRCVNLYPEVMPDQGEPNQVTYYPTPGLTLRGTSPNNLPCRALYRASNGSLFGVFDTQVYSISSTWQFTQIGQIGINSGNPVIFSDNGTNVILVDGTTAVGYTFLLTSMTGFTNLISSGWYGSTYIDFMDTFFIANYIGTPTFYISDSESITFDPSQYAGKSGKPDFLVAAIASHGVIWLIGQTETEVWYGGILGLGTTESGVAVNTFPYSPMEGIRLDNGCCAPYSIAKADDAVFWLSQNTNGGYRVTMGKGYQTEYISTPAIDYQFSTYSTVSDAIGYCYQQRGHQFYVLNFPTGNATWVFDIQTHQWHERMSLDSNGFPNRHIAQFHAFANNYNVVGDYRNGNIYTYDLTNFTDNNSPIERIRSFPDLLDQNANARMIYRQFIADIQVGNDQNPNETPQISLRWSDTRGASWGNPLLQGLGNTGEYITNVVWNRLGMARSRVFELSWSVNANIALNGAFVQTLTAGS